MTQRQPRQRTRLYAVQPAAGGPPVVMPGSSPKQVEADYRRQHPAAGAVRVVTHEQLTREIRDAGDDVAARNLAEQELPPQ